jgi:hypothetical protein
MMLTFSKIVKDTQSSGGRRPVGDLSDETDDWSPPQQKFTEYLRQQFYASTESGPAPLTVDFDASGTYSCYGVMRFNYDGMYLMILDVKDYSRKRGRITKVIFVL